MFVWGGWIRKKSNLFPLTNNKSIYLIEDKRSNDIKDIFIMLM